MATVNNSTESTIALPANTGMWSGPGYRGGQINLPKNQFVAKFNSVNGLDPIARTVWGLNSKRFQDAPKQAYPTSRPCRFQRRYRHAVGV